MSTDNQKLKIGDVVTLKSGGPKMTISKKAGKNYWFCLWFNGGDLFQGTFSHESLTKEPRGMDAELTFEH